MATVAEPLAAAPALPAHPPPQRTDQELLDEFVKAQKDLKETMDLLARKAAGEVLKESQGEMVQRVEKIESKITTLLQKGSRPPGGGLMPGERELRTVGRAFTESEEFKAGAWSGGRNSRLALTYKGRLEVRAEPTPFVAPPPITELPSPPGPYIFPRRVAWVPPPMFPLVMRDLLDVIPLDATNAVEYVVESWTDNTDYQATEGTRKAQGGITYAHTTAMVRTIAQFVKVSKQMLADLPMVQTSIDQRLVYYVLKKEGHEILYGDNSAGHLWGIMPQATAYLAPPQIATSITTAMDMILGAITQIAMNGYIPNAIVLNPTDWAGLQLQKTTFGSYILAGPGYGLPQVQAQPSLWGLPVVQSFNMNIGDFLVGGFPGNAALFDREQAIVEMSFENEDDFVNNLATIRCEERVTLAVYVPLAFVKGTLPTGVAMASAHHEPPPPAQHGNKK